jgi:acyl carrier protein
MTSTNDGIREQILDLLRNRLRLRQREQDLTINSSLEALGLDSMTAIELLLDMERTFGILLPDALLTAETFRTPATLEVAVRSLLEAKG